MDNQKASEMKDMFESLSKPAQAKVISDVEQLVADEEKHINRFKAAMQVAGADQSLIDQTVENYKTAS